MNICKKYVKTVNNQKTSKTFTVYKTTVRSATNNASRHKSIDLEKIGYVMSVRKALRHYKARLAGVVVLPAQESATTNVLKELSNETATHQTGKAVKLAMVGFTTGLGRKKALRQSASTVVERMLRDTTGQTSAISIKETYQIGKDYAESVILSLITTQRSGVKPYQLNTVGR